MKEQGKKPNIIISKGGASEVIVPHQDKKKSKRKSLEAKLLSREAKL